MVWVGEAGLALMIGCTVRIKGVRARTSSKVERFGKLALHKDGERYSFDGVLISYTLPLFILWLFIASHDCT